MEQIHQMLAINSFIFKYIILMGLKVLTVIDEINVCYSYCFIQSNSTCMTTLMIMRTNPRSFNSLKQRKAFNKNTCSQIRTSLRAQVLITQQQESHKCVQNNIRLKILIDIRVFGWVNKIDEFDITKEIYNLIESSDYILLHHSRFSSYFT